MREKYLSAISASLICFSSIVFQGTVLAQDESVIPSSILSGKKVHIQKGKEYFGLGEKSGESEVKNASPTPGVATGKIKFKEKQPARISLPSLNLELDGTGRGEVESALMRGDGYSATRSCLLNAKSTVSGSKFRMSDIDKYRDANVARNLRTAAEKESMPASVLKELYKTEPSILSKENRCTDTEKQAQCKVLLANALRNGSQASYRPGHTESENKELSEEVLKAKEAARTALDPSKRLNEFQKRNPRREVKSTTDRSMEIVVMIDAALAFGNNVAAAGALELLREINPSAAAALDCLGIVGSDSDLIRDETAVNIRGDKSPKVGPLSGIDYSKQGDITRENPLLVTGLAFAGGAAASWAIGKALDYVADKTKDSNKTDAQKRADKAAILQAYNTCVASGSAACKYIPEYEEAVEMEALAKAGRDPFGETKVDENYVPHYAPRVLMEDTSGPIVEAPEYDNDEPLRPEDFVGKKTSLDDFGPSEKEIKDFQKTKDPSVVDGFCENAIQKFAVEVTKGYSKNPVTDLPSKHGVARGEKTGVIMFDKFNEEYWAMQDALEGTNPERMKQRNNCNAMDPVINQ